MIQSSSSNLSASRTWGRTFLAPARAGPSALVRGAREAPEQLFGSSFGLRYSLFRSLNRKVFPFCHIARGDVVVQAGCVDWMLPRGVSHALIAADLAGPEGRVVVAEPDPSNVAAIRDYARRNDISHLAVEQVTIWRESAELEMAFFDGRRSYNTLSVTRGRNRGNRNYAEFVECSRVEMVRAVSIDELLDQYGIQANFVNLTINGSEDDAITGMQRSLSSGANVAFPLWGARSWFVEVFAELRRLGLDIIVGEAPYSRLARTAGRKHHLYAYATHDRDLAARDGLREAEFSLDPRTQDIVVEPHAGPVSAY